MRVEIDRTQPVLLGYVCQRLAASEMELAEAIHQVARFASSEAFALEAIFVERMDLSLAAFEALVDAVGRYGATTVAVPTILHVAILAPHRAWRSDFEYLTGARIVEAVASRHEAGGRAYRCPVDLRPSVVPAQGSTSRALPAMT